MRIIQCDKCNKRYKIHENNQNGGASTYRCKSCFEMIIVPNPEDTIDLVNPVTSDLTSTLTPDLTNTLTPDLTNTLTSDLTSTFTSDLTSTLTPELTNPITLDLINPIPSEDEPSSSGSLETVPPSAEPPSKSEEETAKVSTSNDHKALRLRTKFNMAIVTVLVCAVTVIYFWSESKLRADAEKITLDKGRLILATMQATREYTSKVLQPVLYEALPNRFIKEGMSSSFSARNIFERLKKNYPQYYFKQASILPRNSANQADEFETKIIKKFDANKDLKEWQGYQYKGSEEQFCIMQPVEAIQRCMRCHGTPDQAPRELLEKYGPENGFGVKVGEIFGAMTVSIPTNDIMKKAESDTLTFITMVLLFFVLLIIVANIFFTRVVLRPIKYLADNADEISLGKLDTHINTSGGDEIAKLAKAFERMKISIKMAFDQLAK